MKSVLLIDGQALTQKGISQIISELKLNVLAESCDDYKQLNNLIAQLKPHLLIVDPFFSTFLTFEELTEISVEFPSVQILITYNTLQRSELTRMLNIGIKGFLSKAATEQEVITCVQATMLNEKHLCLQTKQTLLGVARNIENTTLPSLSPREKEIIQLIADGFPDNAIAQKLFLSFHTIRTHRKNITKKLGFSLKNAAELVWLISYLNDVI